MGYPLPWLLVRPYPRAKKEYLRHEKVNYDDDTLLGARNDF